MSRFLLQLFKLTDLLIISSVCRDLECTESDYVTGRHFTDWKFYIQYLMSFFKKSAHITFDN